MALEWLPIIIDNSMAVEDKPSKNFTYTVSPCSIMFLSLSLHTMPCIYTTTMNTLNHDVHHPHVLCTMYVYVLQNPVGAGQYDILRWKSSQHTNGNISVFTSRTPRLPPKVDSPRELLLNERIHPKGIPLHKRTSLVSAEAPN